jgi:hypothetical protein
MMSKNDALRCNICGLSVLSSEAASHASSSSHTLLKKKLEKELLAKKEEQYSFDSSVILRWLSSV